MQVRNAHPKTMPDCAAPGPVRVKKMKNRAPVHRRGQVPCLHKFDGTHFLVAVPQWPAHASTHCEEERSGTPAFFRAVHMGIPVREIQEMEQRDWELLDKQMRGLSPPRNDAIMVLTLVAVFFAGMTLGGLLFPREGGPMQIASSDATACNYPSEWCATNQTAIAGRQ